MQSPFIDNDHAADATQAIEALDRLIAQGLAAKQEAERQKAIYDSIREQACALLRDMGEPSVETAVGKARLKETKSGGVFSEATQSLDKQLKLQQDIEKRTGVAQPARVTLSADIFPV